MTLHTLIIRFSHELPAREAHMDNPNPAKVAKVDEIATKLETAGTVVVTEYRGLDVPAQAQLRAAVKDAGGEFKIYKNTLTKLAAERTGMALGQHLTGPTALAFAYAPEGGQSDPVSLSKALTEFQKTNDALVIKGGVMDGAIIGPDDVTALSKVPPREEMLAMFAGLLQAPMSRFAGLLNAMPTKFAQLTQALIEKGGAASSSDEPAAEAGPAEEAPAEEAVADETDAAPAATEDAAEPESTDTDDAAASDQTEEPAAAVSEDTNDKED
ncbi:MAG: large subunit ribosomal protein L10 [Acidimicrobiales bacterium]|jgi:large subunit ribosomal protein L10